MKLILVIVCVVIVCFLVSQNTVSMLVVKTPQIGTGSNNYKQINQEVINQAKNYFYLDNYNSFKLIYINESVWKSQDSVLYNGFNKRTLSQTLMIGKTDDEDLYRMVFTHEYTHYILNRNTYLGSDIDESLADTYTWYMNKEKNIEIWGSKNERRSYSYTLVMNQILQENNFECLDKVFSKNKKIKNVEDYKNRLKVYCNVKL